MFPVTDRGQLDTSCRQATNNKTSAYLQTHRARSLTVRESDRGRRRRVWTEGEKREEDKNRVKTPRTISPRLRNEPVTKESEEPARFRPLLRISLQFICWLIKGGDIFSRPRPTPTEICTSGNYGKQDNQRLRYLNIGTQATTQQNQNKQLYRNRLGMHKGTALGGTHNRPL